MDSPPASNAAHVLHPYYPPNAPLAHFTANETPVGVLLLLFGGILDFVVVAAIAAARMGARKAHVDLTMADTLNVAWFALCGFLHCFFEGYFIFNHARLASLQTLFAQLWKEYSLSDSRYLTSDPFMLCVESFTVFVWGPLCWAIVASIALRSNLRRPLAIVMCIGHLYGVALYYSTSLTEYYLNGVSHSRPEFLYFWVYYVGFNIPWVVVPALLLYQNVSYLTKTLESEELPESIQKLTQTLLETAEESQERQQRLNKTAEDLHQKREELLKRIVEMFDHEEEIRLKRVKQASERAEQQFKREIEEAEDDILERTRAFRKIASEMSEKEVSLQEKEKRLLDQEKVFIKISNALQRNVERLSEKEKLLQREAERLAEEKKRLHEN